ncbi:MAG: YbjN domain-containing protein [Blastocatellia bacterium]|nr:YbjN domain-containing protein [Blastocatellia bacterium]
MGTVETIQSYLARMSVKTDKPQQPGSNTIVTHYPFDKDVKGGKEIDLVVVYMPNKKLIGFYTYEFGNAGKAKDQTGLYKTLLNLNDRLAIGSFFVDKDQDIGLKFALRTETNVSFDEFQSVYFAMIAAVRQYRSQVAEFFDTPSARTKPAETAVPTSEPAVSSHRGTSGVVPVNGKKSESKEEDTRQRRVKQL